MSHSKFGILKKAIFVCLIAFLAALIGIKNNPIATGAAEEHYLNHNSQYIWLENSVHHASPGSIIMNPLGYFVTIYQGNDKTHHTYQKCYGTVFYNFGSETGRAGYTTKDPQGGTYQTERISDRGLQKQ